MPKNYKIHKDEFHNSKNTEQLLDHLQRRYEDFEFVQKIFNVGYWEYDFQKDATTWSKQLFTIHGIEDDFSMSFDQFYTLIHPDDRTRTIERFNAALDDKTGYEIEFRIVHPDGEIRNVVQVTEFVVNELNELTRIVGVVQDTTVHKKLQLSLIEEEQYYKSLFDNNPDSVFSFDLQGNFLSWNPAFLETFAVKEEEILHQNYQAFVEPASSEKTNHFFLETIRTRTPQNYETTGIHKDGSILEFNVTNIPIVINNELVGVYGIAKNITAQKAVERSLIDAETKYRSLVEQSIVGVFIAVEGTFIYSNPHLNKMMGYDTITDLKVLSLIHPEDRQRVIDEISSLAEGESIQNYHHRGIKRDGSIIIIEVHYKKVLHQGKPATIGTVLDVTERKQTEELNQFLAYHDYLTTLPNRRMFEVQLDQRLKNSRDASKKVVVMLIDLDRFKYVNDTLGHSIGDVLLQHFARRVQECLQAGQTVYRLGGDEFCIVMSEVNHHDEIRRLADKLAQLTKVDFVIDGYDLHVTISIGISMSPEDGSTVETLFKNADTALYVAKSQGRDQIQYYSASTDLQSFKHFNLSNDLRKALDKKEFFLMYMPRVDSQTTKIVGVEALIRWTHPEWGLISPAEFIPIAEETGLIVPIGEWVLREACRQNKSWQDQGFKPITTSVNFSVKQLIRPNILQTIDNIIEETGIAAGQLEIEITESSFISNEFEVTQLLSELKKRNIKVSLDDFGTGYSSLYLLKQLTLDTLKIDRSFVEEILTDSVNRSIIQCILTLAKELDMNVVAEGVETAEQYALLKELQCDEIQGYYFSRPLHVEAFAKLLRDNNMT
ncbi:sensor domain-containing protein [Paenibacillus soyae]|uniref:EAL domain-containing protein n=1 Tax=Paenibacillus soyae TaxID=2969249 RepID=A0A9X2MSE7_9BACL|nr:EAL domain-containing protein [Paenibacillus soyae]MCR2805442.1 EAL domain-containing protein [Paenibacillus soyae]